MPELADYLTVKEAAEFLGMSKNTVRNWAASGKIESFRYPINNYRLFGRDELDQLLDQVRVPRHGWQLSERSSVQKGARMSSASVSLAVHA